MGSLKKTEAKMRMIICISLLATSALAVTVLERHPDLGKLVQTRRRLPDNADKNVDTSGAPLPDNVSIGSKKKHQSYESEMEQSYESVMAEANNGILLQMGLGAVPCCVIFWGPIGGLLAGILLFCFWCKTRTQKCCCGFI